MRDVKLYLLIDDVILYIENCEESTRKKKHVKVINSKKLQDTESTDKDQLNVYTLAVNSLQRKLGKQFHLH